MKKQINGDVKHQMKEVSLIIQKMQKRGLFDVLKSF